jgi:acyl carrier protein
MSDTALPDRVRQMIVTQLRLKTKPDEIATSAPLFGDEGLGLDSIDALELVVGIEKTFGVQIADQQMGEQVLQSVDAIVAFLHENGVAKE